MLAPDRNGVPSRFRTGCRHGLPHFATRPSHSLAGVCVVHSLTTLHFADFITPFRYRVMALPLLIPFCKSILFTFLPPHRLGRLPWLFSSDSNPISIVIKSLTR